MPVSNTHTENPMPLSIETSRIKSARMRLNYGVMKFLAMSLGRSNYILKYLPMKLNMLRWQAHWGTTKSTYVKGLMPLLDYPIKGHQDTDQLVTSIDLLYSWLRIFAISSSVSSDTHWIASRFSSSLHSLAATSLIKINALELQRLQKIVLHLPSFHCYGTQCCIYNHYL